MSKKTTRYVYDIISIGDTSLDHFVQLDTASLLCNLDGENCWLCLNYAEKIPIRSLKSVIGGNACNNAVGSARLGLKAAFYSAIGDDEIGKNILKLVKREKVSLKYLLVQKKSQSNLSIAINFKTERTELVYHQPRKYNLPKLSTAKWIYLTSMGKGFPVVHKQLLNHIDNTGALLAFNPGTHQLLAGTKSLLPILKRSNLLIVNKEEAEKLLGDRTMGSMEERMVQLRMLGSDIVVITDGDKGAYASDGKKQYHMKNVPAKVLEKTGAGDSFSTGFLAALCHEKSIADALVWGAVNAASVIEHIGPQEGLMTKKTLLARIKKSKCKAIKL
ncbi:MAG: carbohydrate kinase family protein [bacterium]|nr:carbohydrate kinase family protein [bacterium]